MLSQESDLGKLRAQEIEKYVECYRAPAYRMGRGRRDASRKVLDALPAGTLLDVGAGRGELQAVAEDAFHEYTGVEPVPYLASKSVVPGIATDLPFKDKSFDTVACLDVLEHLLEDDIVPALEEFRRVARKYVFLTASERRSKFGNVELHISRRPIDEWHALFESVFVGCEIKRLGMVGVSPGWLVRL